MEFDKSLDTREYYNTLSEAVEHRQTIWDNIKPILKDLEQELFDLFSLEESLYITEDFFDKGIHRIEKADILIQISEDIIDEVFESLVIKNFANKYTNLILCIENSHTYYMYENDHYKIKYMNYKKKEKLEWL